MTPFSPERLAALRIIVDVGMHTVTREREPPYVIAVSGGRDYEDASCVDETLNTIHTKWEIALLIEGGATGADRFAGDWADRHEVNHLRIPAKWQRCGQRVAGPTRNREIAKWRPHIWVFFPGGRGTAHARTVAIEHHIPQIVIE